MAESGSITCPRLNLWSCHLSAWAWSALFQIYNMGKLLTLCYKDYYESSLNKPIMSLLPATGASALLIRFAFQSSYGSTWNAFFCHTARQAARASYVVAWSGTPLVKKLERMEKWGQGGDGSSGDGADLILFLSFRGCPPQSPWTCHLMSWQVQGDLSRVLWNPVKEGKVEIIPFPG